MSKNKLTVAVLALGCAWFMGSFDSATVTVSAQAPCAPVLNPPKVPTSPVPPGAPQNLRVITGSGGEPELVWDSQLEAGSGPFVPEPAIADTGTHNYFDRLSLRTDCMVAYSLRSQEQLNAYMDSTEKVWDVTYNPAGDSDPRRQDAAKIVIPANTVSLPNNVRVPIPSVGSDSLLVTWDSWMGREFAYKNTGIGNYKHFQFASPERIWTEVKADFDKAVAIPSAVAMVEVRFYGQAEDGMIGPNVTDVHPLSPMSGQFAIMQETWTRYWAHFDPVGGWYEFSLWVADESRDPVRVINRLQIKPNYPNGATGWQKFWLEYNSSNQVPEGGVAARVAYARNIVMLRGIRDVGPLLERPVK